MEVYLNILYLENKDKSISAKESMAKGMYSQQYVTQCKRLQSHWGTTPQQCQQLLIN